MQERGLRAGSERQLLLKGEDLYGKAVTEYRVSMVYLANAAYSWKLGLEEGQALHVGTHLVHDSHARPLLFFLREHTIS